MMIAYPLNPTLSKNIPTTGPRIKYTIKGIAMIMPDS
jgi:hypothetical protein